MVTRSVGPGQVGELGVDADADNLSIDGLKLIVSLRESDELSGADKGVVPYRGGVRLLNTRGKMAKLCRKYQSLRTKGRRGEQPTCLRIKKTKTSICRTQ